MKKKRWHTAEQIEASIDRYKAKAAELIEHADHNLARYLELVVDPYQGEVAKDYRKAAHKQQRRAFLIYDKKLPYLAGKLAEFRTMQLPALDNHDPSIPA